MDLSSYHKVVAHLKALFGFASNQNVKEPFAEQDRFEIDVDGFQVRVQESLCGQQLVLSCHAGSVSRSAHNQQIDLKALMQLNVAMLATQGLYAACTQSEQSLALSLYRRLSFNRLSAHQIEQSLEQLVNAAERYKAEMHDSQSALIRSHRSASLQMADHALSLTTPIEDPMVIFRP